MYKKVTRIHERLPEGAILVFLTGRREILHMCRRLICPGPTYVLAATDEDLNFTSIVNPDTYQAQWNTLTSVQRENVVEGAFG